MVNSPGKNSASRPLVTVVDYHGESQNGAGSENHRSKIPLPTKQGMHILSLPDPSCPSENANETDNGMERQYLTIRGDKIYEMTALTLNKGQPYGSYFVGSQIISDGLDLYVISQVDPLFWILHYCTKNKNDVSFQPLEQWWQSFDIPGVIQKCICPQQLANVCQITKLPSYDEKEDQKVYKFHSGKALNWLMRKYERVVKVVREKEIAKQLKTQELATSNNRNNGAICNSFNLLENDENENEDYDSKSTDDNESALNKDITSFSQKQERLVRISALQILCEYLSKEWRQKLTNKVDQEYKNNESNHVNIFIEDIMDSGRNKKSKHLTVDNVSNSYEDSKKRLLENIDVQHNPDDLMAMYTMGVGSGNSAENFKKEKKKIPTSAGVKRLAKI